MRTIILMIEWNQWIELNCTIDIWLGIRMIEYNSSQSIKIKTPYLFLYILEIGIPTTIVSICFFVYQREIVVFCCTCEWVTYSYFWLWVLISPRLIYLLPERNMIVAMRQLFCVTNTTRYCMICCVASVADSNYSTYIQRNTIIPDTTVSMTTSNCW